MIPLTHGLILAAILFVTGLTGLVIPPPSAVYADRAGNHD